MKSQVQLLLTTQLVVMLIFLALVFMLKLGDEFSALAGCLASLLPSVYFSIRMLRHAGKDSAAEWLSYAYRADIGKWVLACLLFALIFTSKYQWDVMILFVGYLLVQISGMFVPFLEKANS